MNNQQSYNSAIHRKNNLKRHDEVRFRDGHHLGIFVGVLTSLISFFEYYWLTAIGLGLFVYTFIWYVESLGKDIAIIQILSVIATIQWLLGPVIAYHFGGDTYKYRMYVGEVEYMQYAVPAMVALILVLRLFQLRMNYIQIIKYMRSLKFSNNYALLIIAIGFTADLLTGYSPTSLRFVLFIIAQFKYIGALYLLILHYRYRWLILAFVIGNSALSSVEHGLFHNFILWSGFIFSYICLVLNFPRLGKYALVFSAVLVVILLQGIKSDFREITDKGKYEGSKVELLIGLVIEPKKYGSRSNRGGDIGEINARFNQGWIISAIMYHVPSVVEHEQGLTILHALRDTFLPRLLFKKRAVHVRDNFMRYTGIIINKETSMGISILGESYINFGIIGGIVFMLIWGGLISLSLRYLLSLSYNYPTVILWIPLMFLQVVKAETELVVVLNHGVKSAILLFLFYFGIKKILGWRI